MVIEYDGKKYEFDQNDIDVEQSLKIEKHIGGPMIDFENGVLSGRTVCVQALGWLILRRGDMDVPIAEVNFKVGKLMKAYTAAAVAEAKAQEEAEAAAAGSGPGPTVAA